LDEQLMERQLIVMRHAKSSWAAEGLSDHQRPLNERGRRAAPRVAIELRELGWQPQHILSSDSQRTRETVGLLLKVWEAGIQVDFLASLYLAGPNELSDAMAEVSEEVESLLVVGHNPGWEGVVHHLGGVDMTMKTATAAMLKADCESWSDALKTEWSLENVIHPRELE